MGNTPSQKPQTPFKKPGVKKNATVEEQVRYQQEAQRAAYQRKKLEAHENASEFSKGVVDVRKTDDPLVALSKSTHFNVATLRRLENVFNAISGVNIIDNKIDKKELTQALGLPEDSLLARTIFRLFDVTSSSEINFRTWVTTLSSLSTMATEEEKIRFSFQLYDMNGDGTIEVQELRSLLEAAVSETLVELTPDEVRLLCNNTLSSVDTNGDGTIDYKEYRFMIQGSGQFLDCFSIDVNKLLRAIELNFNFFINADTSIEHSSAQERLAQFQARKVHRTNMGSGADVISHAIALGANPDICLADAQKFIWTVGKSHPAYDGTCDVTIWEDFNEDDRYSSYQPSRPSITATPSEAGTRSPNVNPDFALNNSPNKSSNNRDSSSESKSDSGGSNDHFVCISLSTSEQPSESFAGLPRANSRHPSESQSITTSIIKSPSKSQPDKVALLSVPDPMSARPKPQTRSSLTIPIRSPRRYSTGSNKHHFAGEPNLYEPSSSLNNLKYGMDNIYLNTSVSVNSDGSNTDYRNQSLINYITITNEQDVSICNTPSPTPNTPINPSLTIQSSGQIENSHIFPPSPPSSYFSQNNSIDQTINDQPRSSVESITYGESSSNNVTSPPIAHAFSFSMDSSSSVASISGGNNLNLTAPVRSYNGSNGGYFAPYNPNNNIYSTPIKPDGQRGSKVYYEYCDGQTPNFMRQASLLSSTGSASANNGSEFQNSTDEVIIRHSFSCLSNSGHNYILYDNGSYEPVITIADLNDLDIEDPEEVSIEVQHASANAPALAKLLQKMSIARDLDS